MSLRLLYAYTVDLYMSMLIKLVYINFFNADFFTRPARRPFCTNERNFVIILFLEIYAIELHSLQCIASSSLVVILIMHLLYRYFMSSTILVCS